MALTFVLVAAAAKAIIEDKKRHEEDHTTNNSPTTLLEWKGASCRMSEQYIDWGGWQIQVMSSIHLITVDTDPSQHAYCITGQAKPNVAECLDTLMLRNTISPICWSYR